MHIITGLSLLYLLISSPHFLIRTQRNIMKIYLVKVFGMMVAIPSGTSARSYSSLRGYVSMLIIYNLHYSLKNLFERSTVLMVHINLLYGRTCAIYLIDQQLLG